MMIYIIKTIIRNIIQNMQNNIYIENWAHIFIICDICTHAKSKQIFIWAPIDLVVGRLKEGIFGSPKKLFKYKKSV